MIAFRAFAEAVAATGQSIVDALAWLVVLATAPAVIGGLLVLGIGTWLQRRRAWKQRQN